VQRILARSPRRPRRCKDRPREDRASIAPALEAPGLHSATHVRVARRDPDPTSRRHRGSRPQRLQGRGDHRRGASAPIRTRTPFNSTSITRRSEPFDGGNVADGRGGVSMITGENPLAPGSASAASLGAIYRRGSCKYPRDAPPPRPPRRLRDRRQNPNPVFFAPSPTPFVARDQCHPTHAVQLASLIKPT